MKSLLLYSSVMAFVLGWWLFAFQSTPSPSVQNVSCSYRLTTHDLLDCLSPMQRESLKQALAGNTRVMLELMQAWEIDAEILAARHVNAIKRLPAEKLLQAALIGQLIHDSDLEMINHKLRCRWIQDDCGNDIDLQKPHKRILPQTDMAASFLLALCHPDEIVALPEGIAQSSLHDRDKIRQIPLRTSSLRSEQLHLLQPDVALLAYYSHPHTKELFRQLSIPLYTTKNLDSLSDIQESLLKIGHLSRHPLEATLLSLFMDSAFMAIDNRIAALGSTASLKNVLYLYHHHHYMVPTTKCLSGQLMARAAHNYPGMNCSIPFHETHWRLPLEQETILQAQPDCILMATANPPHNGLTVSSKIFFLDEYVQESPNQYTVLAYYDIFQALAAAHQ